MEAVSVGCTHEAGLTVSPDMVASRYVAGTPEALATPVLVGLIERTAAELIGPYLGEEETTVGTALSLQHMAPTPVGMKVRCVARLVEVDGRRFAFEVKAWDEAEQIAAAKHERFVVKGASFARKLQAKGGQ